MHLPVPLPVQHSVNKNTHCSFLLLAKAKGGQQSFLGLLDSLLAITGVLKLLAGDLVQHIS